MFVGKAVITTQSNAATSPATYYCALEAFLRNAGMMTQRARSADPAFLPGRAKRDQAASLSDGKAQVEEMRSGKCFGNGLAKWGVGVRNGLSGNSAADAILFVPNFAKAVRCLPPTPWYSIFRIGLSARRGQPADLLLSRHYGASAKQGVEVRQSVRVRGAWCRLDVKGEAA